MLSEVGASKKAKKPFQKNSFIYFEITTYQLTTRNHQL